MSLFLTRSWSENQNFGKNSRFSLKNQNFLKVDIKNRNIGQKNHNYRNFGTKSKFWYKIEILVKNSNFGEKQ